MGFFKKLGKGIKKVGKSVKKGIAKTVSRKARNYYRAGGEEGVAKRAAEAEATQLKVTEEQGKKDAEAAAIVDAEAVKAKAAADTLAAANAANATANAAGNARATGFGAASMSREAGLTAAPVAEAPVVATPVAAAPVAAPVVTPVAAPVAEAPITPLTQRRSNSSPIRQLSPRQIVQGKINPKAVDMKAINSLFNSPPKNNKNNINNKKK